MNIIPDWFLKLVVRFFYWCYSNKCMWCGVKDPHGSPTDWGPRNEENKLWCRHCGRSC